MMKKCSALLIEHLRVVHLRRGFASLCRERRPSGIIIQRATINGESSLMDRAIAQTTTRLRGCMTIRGQFNTLGSRTTTTAHCPAARARRRHPRHRFRLASLPISTTTSDPFNSQHRREGSFPSRVSATSRCMPQTRTWASPSHGAISISVRPTRPSSPARPLARSRRSIQTWPLSSR